MGLILEAAEAIMSRPSIEDQAVQWVDGLGDSEWGEMSRRVSQSLDSTNVHRWGQIRMVIHALMDPKLKNKLTARDFLPKVIKAFRISQGEDPKAVLDPHADKPTASSRRAYSTVDRQRFMSSESRRPVD